MALLKKSKKINFLISIFFTLAIIVLFSLFYKGSTKLLLDVRIPQDDKYQVFYDIGNGFNENDSTTVNVKKSEEIQTLNFRLPSNVENLRIDLGTSIQTIYLEKMVWKNKTKVYVWNPEDIITDLKIKNNIDEIELVENKNQLKIVSNGRDPYLIFKNTLEISNYLNKDIFNIMIVYSTIILVGVIFFYLLQVSNFELIGKFKSILINLKVISLCALFMLIIIFPMLSNTLGITSSTPEVEKRKLAEKPIFNLKDSSYKNFFSNYENYVNDNFGYRDQLIKLNNFLKVKLLHTSPVDRVILGKKGWMFFNDEGVIDDYRGTNHFTNEELEKIKKNLEERKKWLEGQGIEYYIMVAPNKHTIYSEYLPSNIVKYNQESRLDQLIKYLSKNSEIKIIDVRSALLNNKSQYILYRKNDTHWNSMGAFVAYEEVVKTLEAGSIITAPVKLTNYSIKEEISGGDLANMLSMNNILLDKQLKLIPNFKSKVVDVEVNRELFPNPNKLVVKENTSLESHSKLLMFRDSFAVDMIPFLSESFSRSVYIWDHKFNSNIIENEKPDVVVYELVERNIRSLLYDNPESIKN